MVDPQRFTQLAQRIITDDREDDEVRTNALGALDHLQGFSTKLNANFADELSKLDLTGKSDDLRRGSIIPAGANAEMSDAANTAETVELAETVVAIRRVPRRREELVALLAEQSSIYRGLSAGEAERLRGFILASFENGTAE